MERIEQCLSSPLQDVTPKTAVFLLRPDSSTENPEDSQKQRATWNKKVEFILSCIGYAVGLGNIWRFPYLCYKSGGGAFLVAYFIFLVICAMPQVFLEMSLGQFASLGFIAIWKMSPIFKGLGFGMVIVTAIVCAYYNVVVAWSLYYMYYSYSMPWSTCGNAWNTIGCVTSQDDSKLSKIINQTSFLDSTQESSVLSSLNNTKTMSSEEFWLYHVLQQSSGIENLGALQWPIVLALFITWILVFVSVSRGIKTSGKVVYVTATLPYFLLACLLIRGVTLPGSWTGIKFFLKPEWKKLLTFKVWADAATQIFMSSGTARGVLLSMASHNKFNNNVYRDSILIPLVNSGTSILAGLVVFTVLGFMAHETGRSIEDVVSQGPGLVFVVYPAAISRLPVPSIWTFLFFFMFFTIALDTLFTLLESSVTALADEYPKLLRKRKTLFSAILCVFFFFHSLPCTTQGGIYIIQLMDYYCSAFSLMCFALFDTVAVAWIYGVDRFSLDISLMIKRKPSLWWKMCWCYLTPASITILLLSILINHTTITYGDYVYPTWSIAIGWILAISSTVPIPVVAIWTLLREKGNLKQRLINGLRPAADWGPAAKQNRILYEESMDTVSSRFGRKCVEQNHVFKDDFVTKSYFKITEKTSETVPLQEEM